MDLGRAKGNLNIPCSFSVFSQDFMHRRLELEHLEREKREREIRELRERELNDRLKEEIMKSAGPRMPNTMDPHWLELQRRYVCFLVFKRKLVLVMNNLSMKALGVQVRITRRSTGFHAAVAPLRNDVWEPGGCVAVGARETRTTGYTGAAAASVARSTRGTARRTAEWAASPGGCCARSSCGARRAT